ncbi:hypothetical protein GC722_11645 [Auraticoccus sp. F435]|uniref:Methyl-accepting chemotaxis protein n=1 Tax=Auraticoccus cholistanensis TaxID=2656650 RepID=A0A6A9V188_9ACTN|nr:hypothetical protein [Auraticoccus cholistanensis]MVA76670.1 hypothetical protein [Auraticoccus cholistanensis]
MATTSPAAPPRRRSPLRIVLVVLACLVGLVLLAVLALVAWVQLRPLSAGDYRLANNEVGYVGEEVDFAGQAVATSFNDLASGDRAVVEASAQRVRDQVGLAADGAQQLGELRAMEDPEVARQVAAVQEGVAAMETYLRAYADAMLPIAQMNATCAAWAEDPATSVDSGSSAAEVNAAAQPCVQQATAVEQAGEGAWTQLGSAQLAFVADTAAALELVEQRPEDFEAHYAAENQAREDHQTAVQQANAALGEELGQVGDRVTEPLNALGSYTEQRAAG